MNTEQAACKQQGSEGSGAGAPARNIHARCSLVQMMNQIWGDIDDEFSHFLTTETRVWKELERGAPITERDPGCVVERECVRNVRSRGRECSEQTGMERGEGAPRTRTGNGWGELARHSMRSNDVPYGKIRLRRILRAQSRSLGVGAGLGVRILWLAERSPACAFPCPVVMNFFLSTTREGSTMAMSRNKPRGGACPRARGNAPQAAWSAFLGSPEVARTNRLDRRRIDG